MVSSRVIALLSRDFCPHFRTTCSSSSSSSSGSRVSSSDPASFAASFAHLNRILRATPTLISYKDIAAWRDGKLETCMPTDRYNIYLTSPIRQIYYTTTFADECLFPEKLPRTSIRPPTSLPDTTSCCLPLVKATRKAKTSCAASSTRWGQTRA